MPDPGALTERQARWFESIRTGLEREKGLTLEQWVDIARACPEQAHRKRLAWMKEHHGLGQNHASLVLNTAFPNETSWSKPDALAQVLWKEPESARLFAAARELVTRLPEVVVGQRKNFTAFSRKVQFAAARPLKSGGIVLGIALEASTNPRLSPTKRESWSERLKSALHITQHDQLDRELQELVQSAWQSS